MKRVYRGFRIIPCLGGFKVYSLTERKQYKGFFSVEDAMAFVDDLQECLS